MLLIQWIADYSSLTSTPQTLLDQAANCILSDASTVDGGRREKLCGRQQSPDVSESGFHPTSSCRTEQVKATPGSRKRLMPDSEINNLILSAPMRKASEKADAIGVEGHTQAPKRQNSQPMPIVNAGPWHHWTQIQRRSLLCIWNMRAFSILNNTKLFSTDSREI